MKTELEEIRKLYDNNENERTIILLKEYISTNADSDEAYFLLGNVYNRLGDTKHALTSYCEAKEINPNSPAVDAYDALQEILSFYNHDLYNP